jgi:hypothetical protein
MDVGRPLIDTVPLRSSCELVRPRTDRTFPGQGFQRTLAAVMSRVWPVMDSTVWTGAVGLAQAIPVIACRPFTRPTTCASDQRRIHPAAVTGQGGCSAVSTRRTFPGSWRCLGVLVPVAARSWLAAGGCAASRAFIRRLVPVAQGSAGLALNRIIFQAVMLSSGGIRRGGGSSG